MSDLRPAEVQRAVDLLWALTRKYRAAQTPFMTACTAAPKIALRRVIETAGYEVQESATGITWRKRTPSPEPEKQPAPAAGS